MKRMFIKSLALRLASLSGSVGFALPRFFNPFASNTKEATIKEVSQ